jgi:hypothetical protein
VTFVARIGLELSKLNASQKAIAYKLIKEMTSLVSNEGYDEVLQLFEADQYLAENGGGSAYGRDRYYLCFNGKPTLDGLFSIKLGGHHLQLEQTYNKGVMIGATPHFIALEPLTFVLNGTTIAPMQGERLAFKAILDNLSSSELSSAKLSGTFNDMILGAKNMGSSKDWQFPATKVGLKVGSLSQNQKDLVLAAIATYVLDVDNINANKILSQYKKELDDTYIGYSGNAALTNKSDYLRIDGPSVWIEFSVQNGIVFNGVHYHSIWRDHLRDYGGAGSSNGVYSTQFGDVSTQTIELPQNNLASEIAPNPVDQFSQFSIHLPQRSPLEINVYDTNYKKIKTLHNEIHTEGLYDLQLDFSDCPTGILLLEVNTNYGRKIVKIVKP